MGTKRPNLGYVVVVKSWRKHGNGAKGGGRLGSTGKKCSLYRIDSAGKRELVTSIEGATAKTVLRELRQTERIVPSYVTIKPNGETFF